MKKMNFKDAPPEVKRHRFNYVVVLLAFVILLLAVF